MWPWPCLKGSWNVSQFTENTTSWPVRKFHVASVSWGGRQVHGNQLKRSSKAANEKPAQRRLGEDNYRTSRNGNTRSCIIHILAINTTSNAPGDETLSTGPDFNELTTSYTIFQFMNIYLRKLRFTVTACVVAVCIHYHQIESIIFMGFFFWSYLNGVCADDNTFYHLESD